MGPPHGKRLAALTRLEVTAGDGYDRIAHSLDPQAHQGGLHHGRILGVSDQKVSHPQRESIQRPAGGNTVPRTAEPSQVLHGAHDSRGKHFKRVHARHCLDLHLPHGFELTRSPISSNDGS